VFSKLSVKELLRHYVLVQLYTDVIPPHYQPTTTPEQNRDFQASVFQDVRLPLYVILRPDKDGGFREVSRYDEGKINDVDAFMGFLRKPLGDQKPERVARASGG
jgi:hypothetical protein